MKLDKQPSLLVDGRFIGQSGLGRYTLSMISELNNLGLKLTVIINTSSQESKLSENMDALIFESTPFTFSEQIEFFRIKENYDFFWSPHFNIPFLKKIGTKHYVTIHDLTPLRIDSGLIVNLYFLLTLLIISIRDFSLIVDTSYIRSKLVHFLRRKAIVIPLALPPELERRKAVNSQKTFKRFALFVGNIKPHKNLQFLMQFWKSNQQRLELPLLYIVGSKELRTAIDLEDSIPMQNSFYFNYDCDDEELSTLYKNCEFFIFPSLSEGFGLPLLEAQHFGALLLSSCYSCLPEVAGDGAIYFDPKDFSSLEKALLSTRDLSLKNQILDNAQRNVSKYSWANSAKHFHEHMLRCYVTNK